MPPYETIHLESLAWVFGIGLFVVLIIALARGSWIYSLTLSRRSDAELEADTHEFGGDVREQNRPVPLLIWLVMVGYFIWAVAYVLHSGAYGL